MCSTCYIQEDYTKIELTPALVKRYTSLFYPKETHKELFDIVQFNKKDLRRLISSIIKGKEQPKEINIKQIKKNLRNKSKITVRNNYCIGNLYTAGANIEALNSEDSKEKYKLLIFPYGEYTQNPCASISFRNFKRDKKSKNLFSRLKMALRTSKVRTEIVDEVINKVNYKTFKVTNPLDNSRFWYTVNLWSK
jgi:hypothetical protein